MLGLLVETENTLKQLFALAIQVLRLKPKPFDFYCKVPGLVVQSLILLF